MNGSSGNGDLGGRVLSLEKVYYTARAFSILALFLIAGFVGHSYIFQIPSEIKNVLKLYVEERTGKTLENVIQGMNALLDESLHIESGKAIAHHNEYPKLRTADPNGGERGAVNQRIDFDKPFREAPQVMVALSFIDHVIASKPNTKVNNLRIRATVVDVDRIGFNYSIVTWGNTDIWRADLSWIAYGYRNADDSPATRQ